MLPILTFLIKINFCSSGSRPNDNKKNKRTFQFTAAYYSCGLLNAYLFASYFHSCIARLSHAVRLKLKDKQLHTHNIHWNVWTNAVKGGHTFLDTVCSYREYGGGDAVNTPICVMMSDDVGNGCRTMFFFAPFFRVCVFGWIARICVSWFYCGATTSCLLLLPLHGDLFGSSPLYTPLHQPHYTRTQSRTPTLAHTATMERPMDH